MKATVLQGQSLFDIALQHCGAADAAYDIALLNGLSITDALEVGAQLELPPAMSVAVMRHYASAGIKPATALTKAQEQDTIGGEGVEFWAIEINFVVS